MSPIVLQYYFFLYDINLHFVIFVKQTPAYSKHIQNFITNSYEKNLFKVKRKEESILYNTNLHCVAQCLCSIKSTFKY